MRSRQEILFRLKQEAANLRLLAAPVRAPEDAPAPLAGLPDPAAVAAALRGSDYAAEVETIAREILAHRFPLLGLTLETGPEIDWRRDYLHGRSSAARYFRFVPYLDFERAGDHKIVWELNRHQHWVLLAQAALLTGREEYLREIRAEFESWTRANPPMRGINWASALEVAFRALSWTWVWHLAGARLDAELRRRLLAGLARHGWYLEYNLSFYFSPNTHLLGEAVALHALGALFPSMPRAQRWRDLGARVVREQMNAQVHADGSHFEQSSYYQVYALDMFLFHRVLESAPPEFDAGLERMADYLAALLGPERVLPFLGDDDGGRLFHPYGPRDQFGRATLATVAALLGSTRWSFDMGDAAVQAAWWLGPCALHAPSAPAPPCAPRLFEHAGLAAVCRGDTHVLVDAGGFGSGSGGHSHSDTLSIVARRGGEELLIDPGTFTYVAGPEWRNRFRGSAAHNTIRIDGRDQAVPLGPFRWTNAPRVEILEWRTTPEADYLDAACGYAGFVHRRRVLFLAPHLLLVLDCVEGPAGEHLVEQFWHTGAPVEQIAPGAFRIGARAILASSCETGIVAQDWRSRALGQKEPAPVIRVSQNTTLPVYFGTMLDFAGAARAPGIKLLRVAGEGVELQFDLRESGRVRFPPSGFPISGAAEPGTGHAVPRSDA